MKILLSSQGWFMTGKPQLSCFSVDAENMHCYSYMLYCVSWGQGSILWILTFDFWILLSRIII